MAANYAALDAALALQPTAMIRFLASAWHHDALYDCDSDPIGRISIALAEASESFQAGLSTHLRSLLTLDRAGLHDLDLT